MAKIETKAVQVNPRYEQQTISEYEMFGWNVLSAQTIDTKNSYLEKDRDGNINQVRETERYVKLTFQRDRDMAYYREIAQLENQYYTVKEKEPVYEEGFFTQRIPRMLSWVALILGALMLISGVLGRYIPSILMGILFVAVGVVGLHFLNKKRKVLEASFDKQHAIWQKKLNRIVEEVRQYC